MYPKLNFNSMEKSKLSVGVFEFDDLINDKLDRSQKRLLSRNSNSDNIIKCLIIREFRLIGDQRPIQEILEECYDNEFWFENYKFESQDAYNAFHDDVYTILKKYWKLNKTLTKKETSWFMLMFSFSYDTKSTNEENHDN